MAGAILAAPSLIVEDTTVSMCNDFEGNDDQLWTAEEFLLFEGTHKELLLCHENYGVSGHLLLMQPGVGYCDVCACADPVRRPHWTVLDVCLRRSLFSSFCSLLLDALAKRRLASIQH